MIASNKSLPQQQKILAWLQLGFVTCRCNRNKIRSWSFSLTLHSFGIGLFVYMRPNFQSLFSRLDIFYPSMLTKPKGKQITACNLNKIFPSGWSIIKNFPQRTQSIAKILSRLFAPFSNLPWTTCKLQLPIHIRRTAKYI